MATITVLDKVFESYIPHEKIEAAIEKMVVEMERNLADKNPLFLVILNGAFMFAGGLPMIILTRGFISFLFFYKSKNFLNVIIEVVLYNILIPQGCYVAKV